MKIALCTVGSTGDIQPFIALGKRLKAAGHTVLAISHPFHQSRFEKHGIDFAPCGPIVTQQDLNEMLEKMLQYISPMKQLELLMMEAFFAEAENYFTAAKAALKGMDLAVCHMVDFLGQKAAAQLGIPRIGVVLAPAGIPTKYDSPVLLPSHEWLNPTYWKLFKSMLGPLDRKAMHFLSQFGEPEVEINIFHALGPDLNLIAASKILSPTYPDLPSHFKATGPWTLPEPEYAPPAELLAFLKRHPKPVVVSFGSMGGTRGPEITKAVLEALEMAGGVPAIIQSGYAGLFNDAKPDNVCFVDYVPHGWLFAQGACVVHHGGAGTTAAACRAGVPSIVVAFISDQPYFARQLQRMGIGVKPLWYRRLTPSRLARRLQKVLDDPAMYARAQALRPDFLAEEGTDKAVQAIEAYALKRGILETSPEVHTQPVTQ